LAPTYSYSNSYEPGSHLIKPILSDLKEAPLLKIQKSLRTPTKKQQIGCYGIGFFEAIPGFFEAIPRFFVMRTILVAIRLRSARVSLVIPSLPHKHYVSLFYKKRRPIF